MTNEMLQQEVARIAKAVQALSDAFRRHSHDDIETDKLKPETAIKGFTVLDSLPPGVPPEGTLRLINDSGTYQIAVVIDGAWRTFTSD